MDNGTLNPLCLVFTIFTCVLCSFSFKFLRAHSGMLYHMVLWSNAENNVFLLSILIFVNLSLRHLAYQTLTLDTIKCHPNRKCFFNILFKLHKTHTSRPFIY